jgi:hypothetical protein
MAVTASLPAGRAPVVSEAEPVWLKLFHITEPLPRAMLLKKVTVPVIAAPTVFGVMVAVNVTDEA